MRYTIEHDIPGRLRVRSLKHKLIPEHADQLQGCLLGLAGVNDVRVRERTGSVIITYTCSRRDVLRRLDRFEYKTERTDRLLPDSGRHIMEKYKEEITELVIERAALKLVVPAPIRTVITAVQSVRYVWKAIRSFLAKESGMTLLDGVALVTSFIRADYETAGTHVFLLGICDILEKWMNHRKIANLSERMSLNVDYVWLLQDGQELYTRVNHIHNGDLLVVHDGEMIPFDGRITDGAGNVVQTSLSGNALPAIRNVGDAVFAGTWLNEGEITIRVDEHDGLSQYEKLLRVVENSEELKPAYEGHVIAIAEKTVPWLFAGSALTWLLTRDSAKMASFLMVDMSYALKLSLPLAVLTARKEAEENHMKIRGGKILELLTRADTIVFDKTGTLTKAEPRLGRILSYGDYDEDELLAMAACLEEHFQGVMASAITRAAEEKHLLHEEMHTDVEKVAAHGVASTIDGKRVVVGTYHFVFEDEGCESVADLESFYDMSENRGERYLFLALDRKLEAVFCIEDQMKEEASAVIEQLREIGFRRIVMMTGDAASYTERIAGELGIREFHAELNAEAKAELIRSLQAEGHCVVMVGDGVNDSLALSAADISIAMAGGAKLALEVADVIIGDDHLEDILAICEISGRMTQRLKRSFGITAASNAALIAAGLTGVMTPAATSTIGSAVTAATALSNLRVNERRM